MEYGLGFVVREEMRRVGLRVWEILVESDFGGGMRVLEGYEVCYKCGDVVCVGEEEN